MPQADNIRPFAFFGNYEGMDLSKSPFVVQSSSAANLVNLHKGVLGTFTAYNQGYNALTTALEEDSSIDGLIGFTDANRTKHLLAACRGKLKAIDLSTGAVGSNLYTNLSAGKPISSAVLKGSLFVSDANTIPIKWDGTNPVTAMSSFPLTNGSEIYNLPSILATYSNRLISANFQGGSSSGSPSRFPAHLTISNELAPDVVTTTPVSTDTNGAIIQVAPGDGQGITALRSINIPALNETYLAIWKESSLWLLTGSTPSDFALQELNSTYGCLNNNCVVQIGGDFIFTDEEGIYSLTTASTSGTIQPKIIGERKILEKYRQLNTSAKDKAWICYHKKRNEVWIAIPTGSNMDVDTILVLALPNDSSEDYIWSIRDGFPSPPRCSLNFNRSFYTGDNLGQINTWFNSSTYNGVGYTYQFQYPYFNFNTQQQLKELTNLNAWFLILGPETVTIRQQWRGGGNNTVKSITKTIQASNTGAVYGEAPPAAIYGSSYYGLGMALSMSKLPVCGNGTQLQLTLSGISGITAPVFLGFSGLVRLGQYSTDYR
jgi:hypothetical protein